MESNLDFFPAWSVFFVLGLGLLSAWFARIGDGSPQQTASRILFFGFLVAVAAVTIVSVGVGPGYWLASAMTFAAMVLVATAETRRSREAAPPSRA
ncbi:MAG: hypothetical protein U1E05_05725 [Patescibacteria group bacterium]|nr:hypothetical protein [Patescibacteria group bacterium]